MSKESALWELPELGEDMGVFWWGGTTKIPPYILSTTEIPKDSKFYGC